VNAKGAHLPIRTVGLSVSLLFCAWAIMSVTDVLTEQPLFGTTTWWMFITLAVICEYLTFGAGSRRRTLTFTFGEVSLVIGLLFASPALVITGRVAGEFLVLASMRYAPTKLLLNATNRIFTSVIALVVFYTLNELSLVGRDIGSPTFWIITLAAVVTAELVGLGVVLLVRRWHGDRPDVSRILTTAGIALSFNTALGLVASIVATVQPWALLLVSGIVLGMFLSYRTHEALDKRYASLEMLNEFTRLVGTAGGADTALHEMLVYTRTELDVATAEIWLAYGEEVVGVRSDNEGIAPAIPDRAAWNDSCSLLSERGGAVRVHPGTTLRTAFTTDETTDVLVAPICERDSVVGLISISGRAGSNSLFTPHDEQVFAALARHASTALENSRLVDSLRHEALHDTLTGLPNRTMFTRVLENATARTGEVTVAAALLDLDGFKEINDTYGHHRGDEVLIEVANRLRATLDTSATVARLGGDEFALVLPDVNDSRQLEELGQLIRTTVAHPIESSDSTLHVGVSVGFALSWGEGTAAQELLRRADVAMYTAKAGNGNGVVINNGDNTLTQPAPTGRTRRHATPDTQP
jgi:diguanylate cyclase (GGDEF)-like protein